MSFFCVFQKMQPSFHDLRSSLAILVGIKTDYELHDQRSLVQVDLLCIFVWVELHSFCEMSWLHVCCEMSSFFYVKSYLFLPDEHFSVWWDALTTKKNATHLTEKSATHFFCVMSCTFSVWWAVHLMMSCMCISSVRWLLFFCVVRCAHHTGKCSSSHRTKDVVSASHHTEKCSSDRKM